MPKDLPGFYYDAEKNRYFPYKGPIPGSSRQPPTNPAQPCSSSTQDLESIKCTKLRQVKLVQARELCGNMISCRRGKLNFQAEYQKKCASRPYVWKYKRTKKMANIALKHGVVDVNSPSGLIERDVLLTGGANGSLCLFQVHRAEQETDLAQTYEVNGVWSPGLGQIPGHKELVRRLGSSYNAMMHMPSDISCIKVTRKNSLPTEDVVSKHFVITTLGSDGAPGSVCVLDLSKPFDFDAGISTGRDGLYELASFRQTLWTADCNLEGGRVVIGTDRGAMLLNMETGVSSWLFRSKSDVLSLQFDQSRDSILCGLRNGAIKTVDTRQKQAKWSTRSSVTVSMSSSVCCLSSLGNGGQYFLASAMDGSIKLYDYRLIQRGPVQSYEGCVNSHTRTELGVDPSETVVMSGGEDCYVRIWNIKSGELLFKERFMNSAASTVCWPRTGGGLNHRCYWQHHCMGAWLGSYEGIFYMDWG